MGEVISIEPYFRKCENCKYHVPTKPMGAQCGYPGGFDLDWKTFECRSFCRKSISGRDPLCGPLRL